MKEFFEKLFKPGEGICTGDAYAISVKSYATEGQYFSINPLAVNRDYDWARKPEERSEYVGRRADINVTAFRSFMFEIDSLDLESQLSLFRNSKIPFTSIVYSGGKSYHAILSVDESVVNDEHTLGAIEDYKRLWKRLEAQLTKEARQSGINFNGTLIDGSCKNPSRLSRYPDFLRSNGNYQSLVQLVDAISLEEFNDLIEECPMVAETTIGEYADVAEDPLENVEDFQSACPSDLMRKLKIVDWACSEGMYPYLLRYTLWAIDSTNVSKETFIEFLDKYTFVSLLKRGYPASKLVAAVNDAYRMKGRL